MIVINLKSRDTGVAYSNGRDLPVLPVTPCNVIAISFPPNHRHERLTACMLADNVGLAVMNTEGRSCRTRERLASKYYLVISGHGVLSIGKVTASKVVTIALTARYRRVAKRVQYVAQAK